MSQRYLSPNGHLIIGTKELVPGVALIKGIDKDGEPEYEGGTNVDWNGQKTVRNTKGKILFVDDNNDEWTFDQLKVDDEAELSSEDIAARDAIIVDVKAMGGVKVVAVYDGESGDGGVLEVHVYGPEDSRITTDSVMFDQVEHFTDSILDDLHENWFLGNGAYGTLTLLIDGSMELDHKVRVDTYEQKITKFAA